MGSDVTDILLEEHRALGAEIGEGADGRVAALRYDGARETEAFFEGVALVDLSAMGSRLVSGQAATAFSSALFAGRELSIGECSVEVALTGDGSIASLVLLARTGTQELAWWDLIGRGDVLSAWAQFVCDIEQEGVKPFGETTLEDASEALVPLLLWGPRASEVLRDYLGEQSLPETGAVANRLLDKIGCLVAVPALDERPCYLVLVPPVRARILWRSFLSFNEVEPVGMEAFIREVLSLYPFLGGPSDERGPLVASRSELSSAGLVRAEPTFIGARALS